MAQRDSELALDRDVDGDGCDDCSVTGADGSGGNPANDGPDADGDGLCDNGTAPGNDTNGNANTNDDNLGNDNTGAPQQTPDDIAGCGADADSCGQGVLPLMVTMMIVCGRRNRRRRG